MLLLEAGTLVANLIDAVFETFTALPLQFFPLWRFLRSYECTRNVCVSVFDDILKPKSTMYKRSTPRPARRLYQTQTLGNRSYVAICHAAFNSSTFSDNPLTVIN